jgi:translation initiation factor eIF-2B subunit gamma
MLLVEPSSQIEMRGLVQPKKKKMDQKQQIYGLTEAFNSVNRPTSSQRAEYRVLFTASREELETTEEKELVIPKAVLAHQPNLLVRSDLKSTHLFIFSRWVLRLLEAKDYLISIRADLVPFLMRAQFRSIHALPKQIHDDVFQKNSQDTLASALDGKDDDIAGHSADIIKVMALTVSQDDVFCDRVNTFQNILQVSHRLLMHKHRDITPWAPIVSFRVKRLNVKNDASIIGQNTHIKPGTKLKHCVIGNDCSIGTKVNIVRCVIMDGAQIGNGCTIQDTVVGPRSTVTASIK